MGFEVCQEDVGRYFYCYVRHEEDCQADLQSESYISRQPNGFENPMDSKSLANLILVARES